MNLLCARLQMALSLGFHIVYASAGITMPLLMVIAELLWLRRKDPTYLALAKAWARGTAVFFAVGAVSGTVLSFELGLLFPSFMSAAGGIIGMPFALEGFAFFTEAIFLGIYLYGWERVSEKRHLYAGMIVALSGILSSVFVTTVNAWMNSPVGFQIAKGGELVHLNPWAAFFSPFAFHEIFHGTVAALLACSVAVVSIHARQLLKKPKNQFHLRALEIALMVVIPCALVQPFLGHIAGQAVAKYQPLKLAAMEDQVQTQKGAPLRFGVIEIPKLLSFLATADFGGEVKGLNEFPEEFWPTHFTHICFQVMIFCGTLLFALAVWAGIFFLRKKPWNHKLMLAAVYCGPLGFLALESGWLVTELGRQPWTIYGILKTAQSVTPIPNLLISLSIFVVVYLALSWMVLSILRQYVRESA